MITADGDISRVGGVHCSDFRRVSIVAPLDSEDVQHMVTLATVWGV